MSTHPTPANPAVQGPLPVGHYFDPEILDIERQKVFAHSARYVGHEQMVPTAGDWRTLVHEGGGRMLLRDGDTIRLLSNVCRHRQALMLGCQNGRDPGCASGNLSSTGGRILCPLHHWSYDTRGRVLNTPLFDPKPRSALQSWPLHDCHGLLFEGVRDPHEDLGALFTRPEFDFSNYALHHVEVHPCHYNWKTFIEVYLEDYHVGPFHPGLGQFVSCDELAWEFGAFFSVQQVGIHRALGQPGTDVYRQWHSRLLEYTSGQVPDFGAFWVTYFPTHMIEVYPYCLVLSTLYPQGPQETVNVIEFHYPEDIIAFEPGFIEAQQAAYMETAIEDDEIAERMDAGRLALMQRGTSESGPYQQPLEDGMVHFHAWYREMMA
ncbi:aromatic ring-hydroxylating dioxygenase subunit alpha [Castellaniella sp.]|uniref:aromatic ring-hydroxylating oxygenase subunit alpha n=1 Tax=Castellaniella sp. TaxID=1955812 RepID=UPI00355FD212